MNIKNIKSRLQNSIFNDPKSVQFVDVCDGGGSSGQCV